MRGGSFVTRQGGRTVVSRRAEGWVKGSFKGAVGREGEILGVGLMKGVVFGVVEEEGEGFWHIPA